MATRADIEINVKGLKKVQELSKQLDKVSGKVNQLNKSGGASAASKSNKLEKESASLQEKKRASMIRVRSIGDQIQKAKEAGLKTDKASRALNRAALANSQGKFKVAKASTDAALLELKALKAQTKELTQQKILRAAQGGGFGGGRGRGGRGGDGALQSALVSGAFPLLFGQGPLGAATGFAGGFIGTKMGGQMGGFAGGLVATAALQQITTAVSAISELGKALGKFAQDTQAVQRALGLQGTAEGERIRLIEETQGKTAAFNAAMQVMSGQIGEKGVQALKKFGESTQLLNTQFTLALTKIQAFAAGIANFVIRITGLEDKLEAGAAQDTVKAAAGEGDEEAKALVERRKSIEAMKSRGGEGIRKKAALEALEVEEKIFAVRRNTAIEADVLLSKSQNLVAETKKDLELQNKINEAVKGGMNKELARTLAILDQTFDEDQKILENKIAQTEEKLKQAVSDKENLETINKIKVELQEQTGELREHVKLKEEGVEAAKELDKATSDIGTNFEKIGESIASGVSDNLTAAIQGTKSLGDTAKSILNDLSSSLIKLGVNTLLSKIPGFGGLPSLLPRANGGPVKKGGNFLVGEKGPELFVPKRSGTIIPNDKLAGGGSTNISVNVDASGSSVQGNEQQGKELGRVISAAIQSELIKQRRPGGLLR